MSSFCSLIHSQVVSNILFCCGSKKFKMSITWKDFVNEHWFDNSPWFDPLSTANVVLDRACMMRYHHSGILFYVLHPTTSMVQSAGNSLGPVFWRAVAEPRSGRIKKSKSQILSTVASL